MSCFFCGRQFCVQAAITTNLVIFQTLLARSNHEVAHTVDLVIWSASVAKIIVSLYMTDPALTKVTCILALEPEDATQDKSNEEVWPVSPTYVCCAYSERAPRSRFGHQMKLFISRCRAVSMLESSEPRIKHEAACDGTL